LSGGETKAGATTGRGVLVTVAVAVGGGVDVDVGRKVGVSLGLMVNVGVVVCGGEVEVAVCGGVAVLAGTVAVDVSVGVEVAMIGCESSSSSSQPEMKAIGTASSRTSNFRTRRSRINILETHPADNKPGVVAPFSGAGEPPFFSVRWHRRRLGSPG
jgi:hypothetical protein